MIQIREISWWYWAVTTLLLFVGLTVQFEAFYLATALSAIQVAHFWLRHRSFSAFPVQVRVAYLAIVLLALWVPLTVLFWMLAIGTLVLVLFGYCFLARILSLMPWNRKEPFSTDLLRRTFLSPPVKGNIMQGLPAAH